jgi:hypothetical protein
VRLSETDRGTAANFGVPDACVEERIILEISFSIRVRSSFAACGLVTMRKRVYQLPLAAKLPHIARNVDREKIRARP